jgi:hypothetical protein
VCGAAFTTQGSVQRHMVSHQVLVTMEVLRQVPVTMEVLRQVPVTMQYVHLSTDIFFAKLDGADSGSIKFCTFV